MEGRHLAKENRFLEARRAKARRLRFRRNPVLVSQVSAVRKRVRFSISRAPQLLAQTLPSREVFSIRENRQIRSLYSVKVSRKQHRLGKSQKSRNKLNPPILTKVAVTRSLEELIEGPSEVEAQTEGFSEVGAQIEARIEVC